MLIFLINSFDDNFYFPRALELSENIYKTLNKNDVDFRCIIVKGGAKTDEYVDPKTHNTVHISVTCNLSDHNVYRGFELFHHKLPLSFDKYVATYVLLHDTCMLSKTFPKKMKHISNFEFPRNMQWVFGSVYGLYNIGICTYDFVLQRATDFKGINVLPKQKGVALEQGDKVWVNKTPVFPLVSYSCYTLSNYVTNTNFSEDTMFDMSDFVTTNRFYNNKLVNAMYISSLGIYKLFGSQNMFVMPVSCIHQPKSFQDMIQLSNNLRRSFNTPFYTYVYYKHACPCETCLKNNGLVKNEKQFFFELVDKEVDTTNRAPSSKNIELTTSSSTSQDRNGVWQKGNLDISLLNRQYSIRNDLVLV